MLLEGLGDLGGHVVLVVLGEHGVGEEAAGSVELAFGDHALALAEEVGEDAGVADGDGLDGVGDGELDGRAGAALEAALGDEAAEADALAGRDVLLRHLLGRVEEDDGVAQRDGHQQHGQRRTPTLRAMKTARRCLRVMRPAPQFPFPRPLPRKGRVRDARGRVRS